jgi:hypothetical protein
MPRQPTAFSGGSGDRENCPATFRKRRREKKLKWRRFFNNCISENSRKKSFLLDWKAHLISFLLS